MVRPIPDWGEIKLFPTDSRSIVMAVLLAVCFSATMQVTERVDAILLGGLQVPLGFMGSSIWFPLGAGLVGILGGLIIANFNPIIALLTATNPLAPVFFIGNTAPIVTMTLLFKVLKKPGQPMRFLPFWLVFWNVNNVLGNIGQIVVWTTVLHLPTTLWVSLWLLSWVTCAIGTAIGFFLMRSVIESGIVG